MNPQHAGVAVVPNGCVPIGTPVAVKASEPWMFDAIYMHPLDVIALQHQGDYDGRMQAAMDWIYGRAERRLQQLLERLA